MQKLEQEFLANGGEFREYTYNQIYQLQKVTNMLNKGDCTVNGTTPLFTSDSNNNGIVGYVPYRPDFIVEEGQYMVIFGDHTRTFNITDKNFCVADNVKVLKPLHQLNEKHILYINTIWKKQIINKGYARHWSLAKNAKIKLPTKNNCINFNYMVEYIKELEQERIKELEAYLQVTGLSNYTLTKKEETAVQILRGGVEAIDYKRFSVKLLFGKSTRGKRLKSADRIAGSLPFVTAGEKDTGISAFIGNKVDIFQPNTVTIDMFGSAKYRDYEYGADDHIAVVHTEKLSQYAAMFVTTAIHKSSHAGQFDYSRNFYATDADELMISLPTKNNHIDYEFMEDAISGIQKLVIKSVIDYKDEVIKTTKSVIG